MAELHFSYKHSGIAGCAVLGLLLFLSSISSRLPAQDESRREVVGIPQQEAPPAVKAIASIDKTNFAFLNERGQVGFAKFSPGLSLIGWELYSNVQQQINPALTIGKNLSIITAGYNELTQAFDTDEDARLDFYQALAREWPGSNAGVTITAGPISDGSGLIYFALSSFPLKPDSPAEAMVMAWNPATKEIQPVTRSQLPVTAMSISQDGILAALLELPSFKDGYYVSLTELPRPLEVPEEKPEVKTPVPAPAPASPESVKEEGDAPKEGAKTEEGDSSEGSEKADAPKESTEETPPVPVPVPVPVELPMTLPSLFIPSELAGEVPPSDLCFVEDSDTTRLIVTCPSTQRLIEATPEKRGLMWQGSIVLRETTEAVIETVCAAGDGRILGGGPTGFYPIAESNDSFRIKAMRLRKDAIELDFTHPVDRFSGIKPETFLVSLVSLQGGVETKLQIPQPVVESDGFTVILPTRELATNSILRVKCPDLQSETGDSLLLPNVYYNIHGL